MGGSGLSLQIAALDSILSKSIKAECEPGLYTDSPKRQDTSSQHCVARSYFFTGRWPTVFMADTAQDELGQCAEGLLVGPHGVLTLTWGQGFVVGAIVILCCLTISNMRRKALLHILILTEVRPIFPSLEERR